MTKKERFVLWLNKLGRGCNRITIIVLYITTMLIFATIIFCANQQTSTSNITVEYNRPSYTITLDGNGGTFPTAGGGGTSQAQVKLFDNYADLDLPIPTRSGYNFLGWERTSPNGNADYYNGSKQRLHVSTAGESGNSIISDTIASFTLSKGNSRTYNLTLSFDYYFNTTPSIGSLSVYCFLQQGRSFDFSGDAASYLQATVSSDLGKIYPNLTYGKMTVPISITFKNTYSNWLFSKSGTVVFHPYICLAYGSSASVDLELFNIKLESGGSATDYLRSNITGEKTTRCDETFVALWLGENSVSYLSSNWASRIGTGNLYNYTKELLFTDDITQIKGYSNKISVGTNSPTSTDSYTQSDSVGDIFAYYNNYSKIVFYSPCTIYAPKNSEQLFAPYYTEQQGILTYTYLPRFTSIVFDNFDTSYVTNMKYMFKGDSRSIGTVYSQITNLDLSMFNTSNVTTMYGMFQACRKLESLNLSSFNTSAVTTMASMFSGCSALKNINLGNFNLVSIATTTTTSTDSDGNETSTTTFNTGSMFGSCSALSSITLPYNLPSGCTITLPASTYYNGSAGPYSTIGTATSGTTVACSTTNNKVTLYKAVASFLTRDWTSRIGDDTSLNTVTTSIIFTKDSSKISGLSNSVSVGTISATSTNAYTTTIGIADVKAYWGSDKSTIVIYSPCTIYAPQDCSYLFTIGLSNSSSKNFSKLITLDLSNFNTSKVTNMSDMFNYCRSLTSLDVSNFNTSAVTDMFGMFYVCESLTILDVSNFNTSNVTNMAVMFLGCSALTSLNLSNFDTSKVTRMYAMFKQCSSLTSLDVSSFNTSKVTNMSDMFNSCSSLTSLNLGNFNTSAVTDMMYMFYSCSSLTSLDLSSFNTSKVTDMYGMFYSCSSLTSLNLGNFNTSAVTRMMNMFNSCSSLTSLNLGNFNTSAVTRMMNMFYSCSSLTSLDLSSFNTSKVTDMYGMFYSCSSLTSLNLGNFNTSAVTDMYGMFYNCSSLTSLDLSSFDTSNVTSMTYMFSSCSSLSSLDLGNFNLASCTSFSYMFSNCSALTSITLPYNLQSGKTISLPASTFYNGSAGPYGTIGTETSGTTVACSTASSKVTLTKK